MSLYLSNTISLSALVGADDPNTPLVLYRGVTGNAQSGFQGGFYGSLAPMPALWSPDTFTYDARSGYFTTTATMDLHVANEQGVSLNAFTLVQHNLHPRVVTWGSESATIGWTFQVFYSFGDDWVPATDVLTVASERPIFALFPAQTAPNWRIRFSHPAWPLDGRPMLTWAASHCRMGLAIALTHPIYDGVVPFGTDEQVTYVQSRSLNNRLVGHTVESLGYRYEVAQRYESPVEFREKILPFFRHIKLVERTHLGPLGSFIMAWRPGDYPNETFYCHPGETSHQNSGRFMRYNFNGSGE